MPESELNTLQRTLLAKIERLASRNRNAELKHFLETHPMLRDEESPADDLLVHAIETGNAALASRCLEIGAQIDGDGDGFPPLFYALARADDDLAMLRLLLDHHADPNVGLINAETPLHLAARENKLLAAEVLVSAGAQVDAETPIDDYFTPTMEASARGHFEMLRLLLEAGANPKHQNRCGQRIVDVAAKRSRDRIARILGK